MRPPKVQAPFYLYRGRSHGQLQDQLLYKTTKLSRHPVYRVAIRGGIIWCYSEETAVPRQQLDRLGLNITYQEGLPEKYGNALGEPSLMILDDLLNQVYSRDVCDLFTKGSHHRNISVLLLTQNLFHQGTNCRDISLNAKYLVLLKNVRDKNQSQPLRRVSGRDTSAARISDTRLCPRHGRHAAVSNQCLSRRRSPCRVCSRKL